MLIEIAHTWIKLADEVKARRKISTGFGPYDMRLPSNLKSSLHPANIDSQGAGP